MVDTYQLCVVGNLGKIRNVVYFDTNLRIGMILVTSVRSRTVCVRIVSAICKKMRFQNKNISLILICLISPNKLETTNSQDQARCITVGHRTCTACAARYLFS